MCSYKYNVRCSYKKVVMTRIVRYDVSESMDCWTLIVPRNEGRANVPRNELALQEDELYVVW